MVHLDRELLRLQGALPTKRPVAFIVQGSSRCDIVVLDEKALAVDVVLATGATPNEVLGIARRRLEVA